jgi:predicted glycosyltransferase
MRVLVYSHDTFGLGNIRRMLAISESLAESDASLSTLILSGSPMLHAFRMRGRIDYVKLPCLARDLEGAYGVKHLNLDYGAALRLRSSICMSVAVEFEPDVVLVDKKPLGLDREFQATLDILSARQNPPRVYLVLRDILDSPEATRAVWTKHDYHSLISRYYDGVLVAGAPSIFDVCEEYAFPAATRAITEHVGYLHRQAGKASPGAHRERLKVGDLPLVLVQAGGGADGAPMLRMFADGLVERQGKAPFFSWIVSGPEMSVADRDAIKARLVGVPNVRFDEFNDDMASCIAAADGIVSMGGYNTVCEVLSARKPALIVPRSKPVLEQTLRAERMARLGWIKCLRLEDATPKALITGAIRMTSSGLAQVRARRHVPFDGLDRIAQIVSGAPLAIEPAHAGASM